MPPTGISHITLRVTNLERSRQFYEGILGFSVERAAPDRYRFWVGDTRIILRLPLDGTPAGDRFSEYRIGVDHLAFAVSDGEELIDLVRRLRAAGVETQGIQEIPEFGAKLVCFRDADNVQWEFYTDEVMRPG